VWLGGVLTAVTAGSVGRQWLSRRGAWLVMLAFLLNPIVFWQMTSAGSPDLWMGMFLGAGVLVVSEASQNVSPGIAVASGILAGGLAGAKYTGGIFAGVLLLIFVVETRSMWKAAIFSVTAGVAGCWPYLRNLRWTGDPVFPYALSWFAPERINEVALASIRETTGASGHRDTLRLIKFLFFAALDPEHFNFSQFFGPLLLVFVPLFLLLGKRTPMWRVTLIIWGAASLAIGATTGMLRFLLPIFGIALAAAFGGAAEVWNRDWRVARVLSAASIGLFLLFGLASMIGYSAPAMAVSLGLVSREEYLRNRAPDYALSEFLNDELSKNEAAGHGGVLVFFRHLYYMSVLEGYRLQGAHRTVTATLLRVREDERQ
jgi:MFS family permease